MTINKAKYYLIIFLLSLVSVWPFFKGGFFPTHDGEWMIIRFSAFHQTLASGQFPVRFLERLNNNYGYPVTNFLYPLPFYLSELPKVLGFNFTESVKMTFILSTIVSSLAMFWALSQKYSKLGSLAGSMIYLYAPYRFVDLYVRGSIGECLAFGILPIILGCIYKLEKQEKIYLPILAISVGLLILSHNVIAVIALPIFISLSLILNNKLKFKTLSFYFIGILTAAFFWCPALYDLQFVKLSQIKIAESREHLVKITDLILPRWGFGPNPTTIGGFSPQLGIATLLVFSLTVFYLLKNEIKKKEIIFLIYVLIVSAFLLTKISTPIWVTIPFLDIIQFPWRLLSSIVFIIPILTAYITSSIRNRFLAPVIITVAVIGSIFYTNPQSFIDKEDTVYSTNEDTTTVQDEYLPLWVQEKPSNRANEKITVSENTIIAPIMKENTIKTKINSPTDQNVTVNNIYFPGHEVFINNEKVPIDYRNKNGLITFSLPRGESEVIIKYGKTPVHLASEIISLVALLMASAFFVINLSKKNGK